MKYFTLSILLIIFVSCSKSIEYTPEYDGEKIVMNGYLSPLSGVSINLTSSYNPFETIYNNDSSHYINNATLVLYKGVIPIDTLINTNTNGDYKLSKDIDLDINSSYFIEGKASGFNNIKSERLNFTKKILIQNIKYRSLSKEIGSLIIDITAPKNDELIYIDLSFLYKNTEISGINELKNISGVNDIDLCYSKINGKKEDLYFIKSNCFKGKEVSITIEFDKTFNLDRDIVNFEEVKIMLSSINKEYLQFPQTYDPGIIGSSEYGSIEPQLSFSNVTGGLGVILPIIETNFNYSL